MEEDLLLYGVAGTVALLGAGVGFAVFRRSAVRGAAGDGKVKKAIAKGDFSAAADRALELEDLDAAVELFLRADAPLRAAQVAERQQKFRAAAELYEKAGDLARAATVQRRAGNIVAAQELEARAGPKPGLGPKLQSPDERAEELEATARKALLAGRAGDETAKGSVEGLAEQAAEAWLALGKIQRAADLCRDLGLSDQAMNLYLNVLADPGAAASVLASKGQHRRAAELYAQANLKERALAAWKDWSRTAADPLEPIAQVATLGGDAVAGLVDTVLAERPLGRGTLPLYYRAARALEDAAQTPRAVAIFEQLASAEPAYEDVRARLARLRTELAPTAAKRENEASAPPGAAAKPPSAPPDVEELHLPPKSGASEVATRAGPDLQALDPLLDGMIERAATRAAELVRSVAPPASSASTRVSVSPPRESAPVQHVEITIRHEVDRTLDLAKSGPAPEQLRSIVAGAPADLSNIEVFYRLGLSLMARGQWNEARAAFQAVEDVSPGYRDAEKRADAIAKFEESPAATMFKKNTQGSRYVLLGELGRGGMAVVYRARDEALGREVALKFLTDEAGDSEVMLGYFKREARAAGSLNHPNIVTIYDVGELDSRPFIAMELVDGRSLEKLIDESKRLPVGEALRIAESVLVALEYAHARKIVHRDIKPANVMCAAGGIVKLMDFGLAKSVEASNKTTMISGTPSYMAPEQLTGKDIGPQADLFAVGATLYEMLSGETPFASMVRVEAARPLRDLVPDLRAELCDLVARALAFDRSRRFGTAAEMLTALRPLLGVPRDSRPVSLRPASRSIPIPREEPESSPDAELITATQPTAIGRRPSSS